MGKKSMTSDIIKLKDVRLSFPRLWEPKAFQPGQTPRYEATFLLDPSNEAHAASIKEIRTAALKLAKAMWPDLTVEELKELKKCYGNADESSVKRKYDGYAGMFYIASANTNAPTIVNRARAEVKPGQKEAPYGGCRVNTNITLWTQDNTFGRGIRCNLRIVQFNRDDTAFSGAAPARAEDEFDALGDAKGKGAAVDLDDDLPF
jgi:hypothetical protein